MAGMGMMTLPSRSERTARALASSTHANLLEAVTVIGSKMLMFVGAPMNGGPHNL
ncbi:hypothetical protein FQA47_009750 [Oryzias melastigma]|uniref:Uncharacterized protein n=1 Tax=Oryzias melastigma TaxID=30732 RepID=A0A834CBQ6_ORYME|nr:hypothetical protein FQA47_009750 [Oryzias melastigma]